MECPLNPAGLQKLKVFINLCQMTPQLLNLPQLDFLKTFIESLGGKVDESDPESDLELDNEGCVEPDMEPNQPMGDASKEPTEEEFDQANDLRSQAASAYGEQKYDEAVKVFTDAIQLNPKSALYYAKRGQVYLKLQKPNACIRDCNRALKINPDSATAYKFRGRANRLLGHWEEAAKDLRQACKLDFDEEADEWLKEVTPNAKKIEQHKQKQERKRQERVRQEHVRKAYETKRKAAEKVMQAMLVSQGVGVGDDDEWDGLFGGASADEILEAFSDPEVSAAMSDLMLNPANITKYQNNPKVISILTKIKSNGGPERFKIPNLFRFPGGPDAGAGAGAGAEAGPGAGAGASSGGGARVDDLD